ncbi:lytic transglycosylase domain-containing protein [Aciditerrimonas ferrireducens]|uniref:Lytic transglycosylase domain-containing protein n=1 Tax=Aciditerrimonas ferrireducens TaxID=667306 RepID=A0ABV6C4C3_9ACTN
MARSRRPRLAAAGCAWAGGLGLAAVVLVALAALVALASLLGIGGPAEPGSALTGDPPDLVSGDRPAPGPPPALPSAMAALYRAAAGSCPGLPWQVLAAVGTVESDNGQSTLPGVHQGANPAGAEGPMQFEPATFAEYARPVPPGGVVPPSPYDPVDAVWAAARLLCANGARGGQDLPGALWAYNHATSYVVEVLEVASSLGWRPGPMQLRS